MRADDFITSFKSAFAELKPRERAHAISSIRDIINAAMFDEAAGIGFQAERCPRCGSLRVVKKGKTGNGEQRWVCKDCRRTFGMGTARILGSSKLPRETWMAYAERFVLMLPLRECAERCHVCLKTAYTMRHRLIDCLRRYSPVFTVGEGDACEIDETYFPESFKGNHTKGTFRMPRESRHRGKQVKKRGLSKEQICVITGTNDARNMFFEVTGRGGISKERALVALKDKVLKGAIVSTDDAKCYAPVMRELNVAVHAAFDDKDHAINRVNTLHSLLDGFMARFRGVSTKRLDAYLAWFQWCRTFMAEGAEKAQAKVARQVANGTCGIRVADLFNAEPPFMDYYAVA